MFRTAVAAAAALVAITAVQPAFAKLSANKLSSNRLSANTLAVGSPTGAVNGVSAIVLPGGKIVRR